MSRKHFHKKIIKTPQNNVILKEFGYNWNALGGNDDLYYLPP